MVHRHRPVPEPRRAGRVRAACSAATSTTWCARRARSSTAWTLSVGPFRVEVLEAAASACASSLEPTEHGVVAGRHLARASVPAIEEPTQFIRAQGRVVFDTQRFAQTGRWEGYADASAASDFAVTPDHWWGTRDRSWGVRPVGEPEPPGIHAGGPGSMSGMWNYFPMQFDDHSIFYIRNERERRHRRAARRAADLERPDAPDRGPRPGRVRAPPEAGHAHDDGLVDPLPEGAGGPLEIALRRRSSHAFIALGTGYGVERRLASRHVAGPDWSSRARSTRPRDRADRPAHDRRPRGPLPLRRPRRLRPLRAHVHRPVREVRHEGPRRRR